jgi:hypothetical protein
VVFPNDGIEGRPAERLGATINTPKLYLNRGYYRRNQLREKGSSSATATRVFALARDDTAEPPRAPAGAAATRGGGNAARADAAVRLGVGAAAEALWVSTSPRSSFNWSSVAARRT